MTVAPAAVSLRFHTVHPSTLRSSQTSLLSNARVYRLVHLPGRRFVLLSQPGGCSQVRSHRSVAELSDSSDVWGQHDFRMLRKEVMRINWFLLHTRHMKVCLCCK